MKRRPHWRRILWATAFAACALLPYVLPLLAFARAGGGQHYPSGGHSSGHGSGHGGGGGGGGGDIFELFYLLWMLVRLCINHPFIGIPVVLLIVGLFIYGGTQGPVAYQARTIRSGNIAQERARARAAADALRAADPAFDEPGFLSRVGRAFVKIQQAWSAQDLATVRPFISDAVYERFSLQIAEQRDLGQRNEMGDVRVLEAALADARTDGVFQEVSVRVIASAIDQTLSLADGRRLAGSPAPQTFVEIWSFLRRADATSLPTDKPGLIEGNCPNCGAAVEMNQSANCAHCGALLRSGRHDWVLAEITQEVEWRPPAAREFPGAAALRDRDPGFNVQELEDRASVLFWRRVLAERMASDRPLRKVATPEYCDRFAAGVREAAGNPHGRTYWGDCGVGSVETLGILSDAEVDRALVEVRWAGTRFAVERSPDGDERVRKTDQTTLRWTLFVLSRRAGVRTNADLSTSSAHCPNCGAPEAGGASQLCEYCGVALNDGSRGWVLVDTVPADGNPARALLDALQSESHAEPASVPPPVPANGNRNGNGHAVAAAPDAFGLLAWMIRAALSDGEASAGELRAVNEAAARRRVPPDRVEAMVRAAQSNQLDVPEPRDRDEAQAWLAAMATVALADGRLAPGERDLLRTAGQRAGLSGYDVGLVLKRARSEMYGNARAALPARRRPHNGNGNGNGAA